MRNGLPELPPVFGPIVALREGGDAVARAVALAPDKGAGTLVWVRAYDRVEAAVVLEPEWILSVSRAAVLAAANALADAIAVVAPPEIPLTLRWPTTLVLNGGRVGVVRLATPPGCAEGEVPPWLVVGIEVCCHMRPGHEPGADPNRTSLAEEGVPPDATPAEITASWARHLMAGVAEWQGQGFTKLAHRTLARLEQAPWMAGARRGLDPASGDLVLEREGGARTRYPLREALQAEDAA